VGRGDFSEDVESNWLSKEEFRRVILGQPCVHESTGNEVCLVAHSDGRQCVRCTHCKEWVRPDEVKR